jgi:hypothetical protein
MLIGLGLLPAFFIKETLEVAESEEIKGNNNKAQSLKKAKKKEK